MQKNINRLLVGLLVLILAPCLALAKIHIGKGHAPTLNITTTSLPAGQTTIAYSTQVLASGGTPPYTFTQPAGTLPTGLSIAGTGVISGTPTVANTFNFTIHVADSAAHTANQTLSITITVAPVITPISITTSSVPSGTVSVVYATALAATGGTNPDTWSLPTGNFTPPGLVLNATGTIAGTPTAAGTYSFTARVTDSSSPALTSDRAFGLTIAAAGGATLFSDGFESGNFSAWSTSNCLPYTATGAQTINRCLPVTSPVHTGTYAAQMYYYLCSNSADPTCGASHQDTNTTVEKDFAVGFIPDHFFYRGYFRMHVNAGGAGMVIGRKFFYLNPAIASTWRMTFGTDPSGLYWSLAHDDSIGTARAECDTRVNRTGVAIYPSSVGTFDSVQYLPVLDQWYYVEVEVQLNSAGNNDGFEKVWVQAIGVDPNPVLVLRTYNVNIRHSLGTSLTIFQVGNQADRSSYLPVNEYRYLDDIKISTAYIGP